jgi:hypothetical protein
MIEVLTAQVKAIQRSQAPTDAKNGGKAAKKYLWPFLSTADIVHRAKLEPCCQKPYILFTKKFLSSSRLYLCLQPVQTEKFLRKQYTRKVFGSKAQVWHGPDKP